MTTSILSYAASPAATAERSQPADPWDAPYFGGTVYFRYRASATLPPQEPTPSAAASTPSTRQPLATDPWDAPYFCGPIYLRFPDFSPPIASGLPSHADASQVDGVVELPAPGLSQPSVRVSAFESVAAPDVPSTKRRGRWGWLVGLMKR
jgi:hypothetical protein